MATNRVKGYFEDQDRRHRQIEDQPAGDPMTAGILFCPNGHANLILPGPDGQIITEALDMDAAEWRGVREVLEECLNYRHGPPQDVLDELNKRMRRLQRKLLPQVFEALMRNKLFNPFFNPDDFTG